MSPGRYPKNPLRTALGAAFFRAIPKDPGVYFMHDARGSLLYIGKAKDLRKRLQSYARATPESVPAHTLELIERIASIRWHICESESDALLRESVLLRAARPPYNIAGTDPEPYLYIGISRLPEELRRAPRAIAPNTEPIGFLLSRTADEPGYRFFGCYRHRRRVKDGYTAILRLIYAATTRKPRFSYPAAIARGWPPWVYETRMGSGWWTELEAFLDGRSPRFLRLLLNELLANDEIPRFMVPSLQQDLDTALAFYRLGPRGTRRMRVRHGLTRATDPVSHAEMDELTMKELGAF